MRSRDEVLTVEAINDRLRELEQEHREDQDVIAVWRGRATRAENRIRELEAQQAASEPVTHDHAARLLREMYRTDELWAELVRRGAASEPFATGSLCCATLTVQGRDYICGEKADHHGEHISPVSHVKWCDSRTPHPSAAAVPVCGACHGEREVSEHECCGNSTNGECCGQSVEVRVPCLFCGDGTVNAASEGASDVVANQCDGCNAGMPLRDGLHHHDGRIYMGCTADRYTRPTTPTRGSDEWYNIDESSDAVTGAGDR